MTQDGAIENVDATERALPAEGRTDEPRRVRVDANRLKARRGLIVSFLADMLFRAYRIRGRRTRDIIRRLVMRLEGDAMFSHTLRRIFSEYHGIDVGMYTHGGCFVVANFPPGTQFGRYCSIAVTARAHNANHPMNLRSSHALFFNPAFGLATEPMIPRQRLVIGNDVWLGDNSIILPSVSSIGDGAVIGAGVVVHKNIPAYAVVVGNPCRVVRYRFPQETIDELLESRWWERSIAELVPELERFQSPLSGEAVR